jgi:hypothetical protein
VTSSFESGRKILLTVGLGLCLGAGESLAAQEANGLIPGLGSLSDSEIESSEGRLTLRKAALDNEALARKLALAQETIASLTQSLAVANGEAEEFRRIATELKFRMEALGLDVASGDRAKLEQRLLKAVSDLRLLREEKEQLADRLVALQEVVVRYSMVSEGADPETRLELETQLRESSKALGVLPSDVAEAKAVPATLTDALAISVKDDLSLVVANVGSKHGAMLGMPFRVWRGDREIGLVRVVDVREKISGAVIQALGSDTDTVKVGDRLRVDAQK